MMPCRKNHGLLVLISSLILLILFASRCSYAFTASCCRNRARSLQGTEHYHRQNCQGLSSRKSGSDESENPSSLNKPVGGNDSRKLDTGKKATMSAKEKPQTKSRVSVTKKKKKSAKARKKKASVDPMHWRDEADQFEVGDIIRNNSAETETLSVRKKIMFTVQESQDRCSATGHHEGLCITHHQRHRTLFE